MPDSLRDALLRELTHGGVFDEIAQVATIVGTGHFDHAKIGERLDAIRVGFERRARAALLDNATVDPAQQIEAMLLPDPGPAVQAVERLMDERDDLDRLCSERLEVIDGLADRAVIAERHAADFEAGGQRLYCCLARFDRRDGSHLADIVQAAREGWERSHPDMAEDDAWRAYDRLSDDAPTSRAKRNS